MKGLQKYMKRLYRFLLCICCVAAMTSDSRAALLGFEELSPGTEWVNVPNGYGGLQWYYFGTLSGALRPPREGYYTGMISPTNVAFNILGEPAAVYSDRPFGLSSGYFTAAFGALQIRIRGFSGTNLIYETIQGLTTQGPTLINLNYSGVTKVSFETIPSGNWFVMDNLRVRVDSDGDGVSDDDDQCPNTAPGAIVTRSGCSIDQLVPCAGPVAGGKWKNHGEYVKTFSAVAYFFFSQGLLSAEERDRLIGSAARSNCGKK